MSYHTKFALQLELQQPRFCINDSWLKEPSYITIVRNTDTKSGQKSCLISAPGNRQTSTPSFLEA